MLLVLFIPGVVWSSEPDTAKELMPDTSSMENAKCPEFLDYTSRLLHSSKEVNLCQVAGNKPVLIVNTASHCGFTKHFKPLEAIHQQYKDQGLVVIGFPSDDFFQEDDEESKAADICFVNYGVTFTMLAPSSVRGDDANAVFKFLAKHATSPKWNFYKYIVSNGGAKVKAYSPLTSPTAPEFIEALEIELGITSGNGN